MQGAVVITRLHITHARSQLAITIHTDCSYHLRICLQDQINLRLPAGNQEKPTDEFAKPATKSRSVERSNRSRSSYQTHDIVLIHGYEVQSTGDPTIRDVSLERSRNI